MSKPKPAVKTSNAPIRAELTKAQRTAFTKRRAQIWEALHPDEKQVEVSCLENHQNNSGADCAIIPERGRGRPQGFASATAAATGQSKATTNRAIARADAIGLDTLDKLTNTSLDSGVELDALARLPEAKMTEPIEPSPKWGEGGVNLVSATFPNGLKSPDFPDCPDFSSASATFSNGLKQGDKGDKDDKLPTPDTFPNGLKTSDLTDLTDFSSASATFPNGLKQDDKDDKDDKLPTLDTFPNGLKSPDYPDCPDFLPASATFPIGLKQTDKTDKTDSQTPPATFPIGLKTSDLTDLTDFLPTTNQEFLTAVFAHYAPFLNGAVPHITGFKGDPGASKSWGGTRWTGNKRPDNVDWNWYLTLAVYDPNTNTRRKVDTLAICGLMFDDIGTKALPRERFDALPPAYWIETSPGNYQAGYLFDVPQTDLARVSALNDATVEAGLCDPGAKGPETRYGRLPFATNGKPENNGFKCRLVEWHPERRYTIDQIIEGLELTPPKETVKAPRAAANRSAQSGGTDEVFTPRPDQNKVIKSMQDRGLYKRPLGGGSHDITCPWAHEHTGGVDHGTVYFEPSPLYPAGGFKCQHAHGDGKHIGALLEFLGLTFTEAKHRPCIDVRPGALHQIADAGEKCLAESGLYYQSGGLIVCVNTDPSTNETKVTPLKLNGLVKALSMVATWRRFDERKGALVVTDPPSRHTGAIFDSECYPHLPALAGLARQPFLRADHSLCKLSGYDPVSGFFGVFDAKRFTIPDRPTREQALTALAELQSLICEFPFTGGPSGTDYAACLAAILTAAIRPSLEQAPMFHVKAPIFGAGKSYLTGMIGAFCSPSVTAKNYPTTEEEAEKMLLATLMEAPACLVFDNVTTDLKPYPKLCSALSEPWLSGRILGISKNATVGTRVLFLSSGNNVVPIKDMARRVIVIGLDPLVECPAGRHFDRDPLRELRADRERYVSLAMTVIMAWLSAGSPKTDVTPMNGFGQWRDLVCQPLMWLGLPDPAAGIFEQMKSDPDAELLGRLLVAWRAEFGGGPGLIREAVKAAELAGNGELREVLSEIADKRGEIDRQLLGRWIKRHAGRIVDGLRFEKSDIVRNADCWKVRSVTPQKSGQSGKSGYFSQTENVSKPKNAHIDDDAEVFG